MGRVRLGWRFSTLESESEPDDDGWITCTIRADSEEVALECALTLAGQAEVIEPLELRDKAVAWARTLLGRLEGADPQTDPPGSVAPVIVSARRSG